MAHIDYFFSTLSPYAYLAGTRMEDVADKHGATVTYKPVDVMGLFGRTGGTPPKARNPNRQELVHSFMSAVWAEEKDIAQDEVVKDKLSAAGFDPSLADSGLLAGAETFAANLEEAVSRGVFGSPFYITDKDQRFWGQDRIEDLDLHLAGKL
mgnify:CR=1 FL=1